MQAPWVDFSSIMFWFFPLISLCWSWDCFTLKSISHLSPYLFSVAVAEGGRPHEGCMAWTSVLVGFQAELLGSINQRHFWRLEGLREKTRVFPPQAMVSIPSPNRRLSPPTYLAPTPSPWVPVTRCILLPLQCKRGSSFLLLLISGLFYCSLCKFSSLPTPI